MIKLLKIILFISVIPMSVLGSANNLDEWPNKPSTDQYKDFFDDFGKFGEMEGQPVRKSEDVIQEIENKSDKVSNADGAYEIFLTSYLFPTIKNRNFSSSLKLVDDIGNADNLNRVYPIKSTLLNAVPKNIDFKGSILNGTGMTLILNNSKRGRIPVVLNAVSGDRIIVFDAYKRSFYLKKVNDSSPFLSLQVDDSFVTSSNKNVDSAFNKGDIYLVESAQLASVNQELEETKLNYLADTKFAQDPECSKAIGEIKIDNNKYYFNYSLVMLSDSKNEIPCRGLFSDQEVQFNFAGKLSAKCSNGKVEITKNNCGVMVSSNNNQASCSLVNAKSANWSLPIDANENISTEAECRAIECNDNYILKNGKCITNKNLHCQSVEQNNVTCLHTDIQYVIQGSPDLLNLVNQKGYKVQKDPGWCAPAAMAMVHTAFVRERSKYTNIGNSPVIIPNDLKYDIAQKYQLVFDYMLEAKTDIVKGGTSQLLIDQKNNKRFGVIGALENFLGKKFINIDTNSDIFKNNLGETIKPTGDGFAINKLQDQREKLFVSKMPMGLVLDDRHAYTVMGIEFSRYLKLRDPWGWGGVYDVDIGDEHQGMVFAFGNITEFENGVSHLVSKKNGYSKELLSISISEYVKVEN